MRPDWDEWAMGVAQAVSVRGECVRAKVGAVILDTQHRIAGSGYNGAPRRAPSCLDGHCPRAHSDVPPGSSYDTGPGRCIAIHAEQNAILDCEDRYRLQGSTLYCTAQPCDGCLKMIAAVGIARIIA